MNVLFSCLNSRKRGARLAVLIMAVCAVGALITQAQSKNPPYSLFQFATLTGSGNSITATRVPVITASGKTIYKNVTAQFDVDADGNLTLSSDYPQVTDTPALLVSSFKAGSYVGPVSVLGGKTAAFVDGPGVLDGGAMSWSMGTGAGADSCTYPSSATWYVGSIASNPVGERLKKAGITSTAWSYGVASGPKYFDNCTSGRYFERNNWGPGTLIGVSQSGNSITIASFTDSNNGVDRSAPVDQITYRLVP